MLFINCWFCNYIISYSEFLSNRWRLFLLQWGSFITDTIFKRKYESKKSIKFEPIHLSRNKKWIRYLHYSRPLFEESENIQVKNIFQDLRSFKTYKAYEINKIACNIWSLVKYCQNSVTYLQWWGILRTMAKSEQLMQTFSDIFRRHSTIFSHAQVNIQSFSNILRDIKAYW